MRLDSKMTKDDVYQALSAAVARTWGEERLIADGEILALAAKNIWTVLQVPLTPFSEEPDLHITEQPLTGVMS